MASVFGVNIPFTSAVDTTFPVSNVCAETRTWGSKLIAHKNDSGRVDMELDTEVPIEGAWLNVYDYGNDGDLSGPHDRATIGGIKRVNKKVCGGYTISEAIDVRGGRYFQDVYREAKKAVVMRYAAKYLRCPGKKCLPPGDQFSGEFEDFVRDAQGNRVGFTARAYRPAPPADDTEACRKSGGVTIVQIDTESYPEGVRLIAAAVDVAEALNSAALCNQISRVAMYWNHLECRAYGIHCLLTSDSRYPQKVSWQDNEKNIEHNSQFCLWNEGLLSQYLAWARHEGARQCVEPTSFGW